MHATLTLKTVFTYLKRELIKYLSSSNGVSDFHFSHLFKLPGVNTEDMLFSRYFVFLCQAQNAVVSKF